MEKFCGKKLFFFIGGVFEWNIWLSKNLHNSNWALAVRWVIDHFGWFKTPLKTDIWDFSRIKILKLIALNFWHFLDSHLAFLIFVEEIFYPRGILQGGPKNLMLQTKNLLGHPCCSNFLFKVCNIFSGHLCVIFRFLYTVKFSVTFTLKLSLTHL